MELISVPVTCSVFTKPNTRHERRLPVQCRHTVNSIYACIPARFSIFERMLTRNKFASVHVPSPLVQLWGHTACNNWGIPNISNQQAVHAWTVLPASMSWRHFVSGSISMVMKIGFFSLLLYLLHNIYYEAHQWLLWLWIKNEKQNRAELSAMPPFQISQSVFCSFSWR